MKRALEIGAETFVDSTHLTDGGMSSAPWPFSGSVERKAAKSEVKSVAFAHSLPAADLEAFAARSD